MDSSASASAGLRAVVSQWLAALTAGWENQDPDAVCELFEPDGYWKDIISFTWAYRTFAGLGEIERGFKLTVADARPRDARISPDRTPPRLVKRSARQVIEAYFDFDTDAGRGTGFVRLPYDPAAPQPPRAWILLTTLQELAGSPPRLGEHRPTGVEFSESFAGDNWLDQRRKTSGYDDRDPEVLIVGGGHSSLILAARLGVMGVDVLVVERNPRIGDNWRNRYHSLTLHNEVWANSMPYLPFPPTWPTFVPKDKLASWLEAYAESMELNVWTGTTFAGGEYDEASGIWTVRLTRDDGTERTLRCPHLVLATGGSSGVPRIARAARAGGLRRRGGALQRLRQRHQLPGQAGHRLRHRQQRPRRGPGPARQRRRRSHDHPAQPDLRRQPGAQRHAWSTPSTPKGRPTTTST